MRKFEDLYEQIRYLLYDTIKNARYNPKLKGNVAPISKVVSYISKYNRKYGSPPSNEKTVDLVKKVIEEYKKDKSKMYKRIDKKNADITIDFLYTLIDNDKSPIKFEFEYDIKKDHKEVRMINDDPRFKVFTNR